jgi:hypothetical protein
LHLGRDARAELVLHFEPLGDLLVFGFLDVRDFLEDVGLEEFSVGETALDDGFAGAGGYVAEEFEGGTGVGVSILRIMGFYVAWDYLMFKSMARSGWTVAFRKKEHVCRYSSEKSDWDMCMAPRTVQRKAGAPCSVASFISDMALSKFDCQYINASELMPSNGA